MHVISQMEAFSLHEEPSQTCPGQLNLPMHGPVFTVVHLQKKSRLNQLITDVLHSDLPNITSVTTKVHVILRRSAMLTWMHDTRELM